jgi:hypothetical protein
MLAKKIMIGQTPYRNSCLRIAPSIINQEQDIFIALKTLKNIMENLTTRISHEEYIMHNGYLE